MLEEYFCIIGELIPKMTSTSYEIFNWALQACVFSGHLETHRITTQRYCCVCFANYVNKCMKCLRSISVLLGNYSLKWPRLHMKSSIEPYRLVCFRGIKLWWSGHLETQRITTQRYCCVCFTEAPNVPTILKKETLLITTEGKSEFCVGN